VTGSKTSSATQRDRLSRTPTVNFLLRLAPSRVLYMTMILSAAILGDSMIYNVLPSGVDFSRVSVALAGVLLSANRIVWFVSKTLAAWVLE